MKIAEITFKHVRDCPHWSEGYCLYDPTEHICNDEELALPPVDCPLPDVNELNV